jgi:hypothetical protein
MIIEVLGIADRMGCPNCGVALTRGNQLMTQNNNTVCHCCAERCVTTGEIPSRISRCDDCGDWTRTGSLQMSPIDSALSICPSCYERSLAIDLDAYAKRIDDRLEEPRAIAKWKLVRADHEAKAKNPIVLGVELEMELAEESGDIWNQKRFRAITNKYAPGLCVWKSDGSIRNGAELVFTPMTLQAFREAKIYDLLKALREAGARSYESGRCGLHVHVPKNVLDPSALRSARNLFYHNREAIVKLTKRNSETLAHWAKIPGSGISGRWGVGGDRYCAINSLPSATHEFRIFRGTLDYNRFMGSLEFSDAVCRYARWACNMWSSDDLGLDKSKIRGIDPSYISARGWDLLGAFCAKAGYKRAEAMIRKTCGNVYYGQACIEFKQNVDITKYM